LRIESEALSEGWMSVLRMPGPAGRHRNDQATNRPHERGPIEATEVRYPRILARLSGHASRAGADQLAVLDLNTGVDKGRVDIPSPSQAFLFPAPGFARDIYYHSLTTIARVTIAGTPQPSP
jgi:hypothetical protein